MYSMMQYGDSLHSEKNLLITKYAGTSKDRSLRLPKNDLFREYQNKRQNTVEEFLQFIIKVHSTWPHLTVKMVLHLIIKQLDL